MFKTVPTWPVLAAIVLTLCLSNTIPAQSSLFTVPTSDVIGKDQIYIETDFDTHFGRISNGGWQSYGLFGIYGVGEKAEIGLNGYFLHTVGGLKPLELQPNFKLQAYKSESQGVGIAVGAIAYIPVAKEITRDTVVSGYSVASKKFKGEWSPRFTGGGYQLIGAGSDSGSTLGALFGLEQPLHRRVSFIADWNSGKNRFGYAAAGFGLTLTSRSYLWTAYYFGNEGRANNSFGVYYGYSF